MFPLVKMVFFFFPSEKEYNDESALALCVYIYVYNNNIIIN